ncbi:MAG: hypothetical protein LBO08_02790 [Rickettsiales bacterium]|jgi:hypothetical protein|nr:hypothetical protein [Rickettsiales bacterium]
MRDKIKNFFVFLGHGWTTGIRGKFGLVLLVFGVFLFSRLFFGDISIQGFVINAIKYDRGQHVLDSEMAKYNEIENHIKLIQEHSPDYMEEISIKYLNMANKKTKILKI